MKASGHGNAARSGGALSAPILAIRSIRASGKPPEATEYPPESRRREMVTLALRRTVFPRPRALVLRNDNRNFGDSRPPPARGVMKYAGFYPMASINDAYSFWLLAIARGRGLTMTKPIPDKAKVALDSYGRAFLRHGGNCDGSLHRQGNYQAVSRAASDRAHPPNTPKPSGNTSGLRLVHTRAIAEFTFDSVIMKSPDDMIYL
jgi:hypothetical protein